MDYVDLPSQNYPQSSYVFRPGRRPPLGKTKILLLLIAVVSVICLGIVISLILIRANKSDKTNPLSKTTPTPKAGTPQSQSSPNGDCSTLYSSLNLQLKFFYDRCQWAIEEKAGTLEDSYTNTIIAHHKNSSGKVFVRGDSVELTPIYRVCRKAEDINNIYRSTIRFKIGENLYSYLNITNNYGIKGNPGAYGEMRFMSHIEAFPEETRDPEVNICWEKPATLLVNVLNPKPGEANVKEISYFAEVKNESESFLTDADLLVRTIASTLYPSSK